jgi:quinol monooxygenase YgiN
MAELVVVARLHPAAGEEEAVGAALPRLISASRTEPGNIDFTGYRSLEDPNQYLLFERYASRAAFDSHLASPHYQEIAVKHIVPRLDSRVIEEFEVTATDAG